MEMYWRLQGRRINRHFIDFGLPPVAGYIILLLVFVGFSAFLFYRLPYPAYIYAILGLSLTSFTAAEDRISFLKQHLDDITFRRIRWVENLLVVTPFVIVLLIMQEWLVAGGLVVMGMLMTFSSLKWTFQSTMPTPFFYYPFEFATGFRKNYLLVFLAIFLEIMAVVHANGNLSLFVLGSIIFLCMSFYTQTENAYWVWIHAMSPGGFLWNKIRTALGYGTVMSLPFLLVTVWFFPALTGFTFLVYGTGMIYLITAVLGKYAFFPTSIPLPQGIMLAISFWFPPLLLFLVPYFFRRATAQLKSILVC